jgi:hypothetical protein
MTYPPQQQPGNWPDPSWPPQQQQQYPDPAQQPYADPASGGGAYGTPASGGAYGTPTSGAPGYGAPTSGAPDYQGYGVPASPAPAYPATYGYGTPAVPVGGMRTNGLAIAALVCSLAGIFTCISAPVGAILGHVARKQIRERGEQGDGMALAGIIVGWIITGLVLAYFAVLLVIIIIGASTSSTTTTG